MPDKILRIRDLWRSSADVVLEIEAISPEGARYIKIMSFKQAMSQYDPLELCAKLMEYEEELKGKISLATMLMEAILPGRQFKEP
jgi:hypothetical protein